MSSENKIRVAVLTRGDSLEAWEIAALEAVRKLKFAEIVLEIRDGSALSAFDSAQSDKAPRRSFANKISKYRWSRLFWNRWFKKCGKVNATKEVSTSSVFQNVPKIDVVPEFRGKHSQYFAQADIEKVMTYQPDVILRFGFNILRGEILNVAKHGVWSYHHADHERIRGGPAGFWEYILRHDETGAILQRLTDKLDDGIVLRRGYWALVKHSFQENLDSLLMNSSGWIANALTEIHHHGKIRPQNSESASNAKVYSYPGNLRMIHFWLILFGNKIAFHWNNLFCPETWEVGIVDQGIGQILEKGITGKIEWIRAKKNDSYLADPMRMVVNGKDIIAAEYFCGEEQRSRIVDARTEETIYHPSTHVSFPLYFNFEGVDYMLPEQSATGKCELIAIGNSNNRILLVDEPLVDPILILHNDTWWLFAHHLNNQNNSALFIYHTKSVRHGFQPHPLNPVKTDINNSRSAGPILHTDGVLFRPAQRSGETYGAAVVINRIEELTETAYREFPVQTILPKKEWSYNRGLHTIHPFGKQTLIDAKSFRFNFANFKAQFSRKARRISGK